MPRQIDGEHAADAGPVAHAENAADGLDAAPADRQAKAETGLVRAALRERLKHLFRVARRKAAAIVLDFDQHAIADAVASYGGLTKSRELFARP